MNVETRSILKRKILTGGLVAKLGALLATQRGRLESLSVLLFVRFVTAGLGFVTTIKIANVLGKAGYGEFAYALALGTYGAAIVRYGLNRTLVRDLIHDQDNFDVLVMASIALRAVLLLVVVFGLAIWKKFGDPSGLLSAVLICIVVLKCLLSFELHAVYDAWRQFKRHAIYALAERCLYFTCIWIAVLFVPDMFGLWWIAGAMAISTIFYMIVQYRWAFARIRIHANICTIIKTVASLLKHNITIWVATMAALSFGSFNQIVLRHLKGTQELGGYAVAWQLVVVANMLVLNISRIGNPATAKITRPGTSAIIRRNFMAKYIGVMLLAAIPVSVPVMICPKLILGVLFRPEYQDAAPIMRILGVYILFLSTGLAISQYVISARMDKIYLSSVILGGIIAIGLNFLLIPSMAGLGAALALIIGHGISMAIYWWAMIRHIGGQKN
jgi:O-antigen/teichoic acid export membrane protein